MRKVIVSLAPVRAGDAVDANALAEDVKKSVDAGAAMCHLHCRRPDGSLTADISYMEECFETILKKTDVVVQASTGGVSDLTIEERCNPLKYEKVESASLNGGVPIWGRLYIVTPLMISGTVLPKFIKEEFCRRQKYLISE